MRRLPYAAEGAGARIAAADTCDAGRRRTATLAASAISGARPQVDAMDLGSGFWTGSDGRLRALYNIYPTLGAATGRSRIRGVEPAKPDDFSGRNVERMAIDADTPRGAGDGYAGGTGGNVPPPADPAGFGPGPGLRRVLHDAGGCGAGVGHRRCERGHDYRCDGRHDQS